LTVEVDGQAVNAGVSKMDLGNGMSVNFNKNRREAQVRTPLFVYTAVNSDGFVNQKMLLLDDGLMKNGAQKSHSNTLADYQSFPLHGILGQTWKNIIYHDGRGPQIEGHVDDYRVEDQNEFGTEFYFNLFKN